MPIKTSRPEYKTTLEGGNGGSMVQALHSGVGDACPLDKKNLRGGGANSLQAPKMVPVVSCLARGDLSSSPSRDPIANLERGRSGLGRPREHGERENEAAGSDKGYIGMGT